MKSRSGVKGSLKVYMIGFFEH